MKLFTKLTSLLMLLFSLVTQAQELNNYQYISVPDQFEFQKDKHDYEVNRLTQFLFNKYNFKAIIKGEAVPDEVDICDLLETSITGGGMFTTALVLKLTDCKGKVVYTSPVGKSIKKDYKIAYHEAIRKIFEHPFLKNHQYKPVKNTRQVVPRVPQENSEIAKPRPVKPINQAPKMLKGKKITETPAKASGPSLTFELRDKKYEFIPLGKNYVIKQKGKAIGKAVFNPEESNYTLEGGTLSGSGFFDDYGNFELNRVNPVTQKPIKDILARVE